MLQKRIPQFAKIDSIGSCFIGQSIMQGQSDVSIEQYPFKLFIFFTFLVFFI